MKKLTSDAGRRRKPAAHAVRIDPALRGSYVSRCACGWECEPMPTAIAAQRKGLGHMVGTRTKVAPHPPAPSVEQATVRLLAALEEFRRAAYPAREKAP